MCVHRRLKCLISTFTVLCDVIRWLKPLKRKQLNRSNVVNACIDHGLKYIANIDWRNTMKKLRRWFSALTWTDRRWLRDATVTNSLFCYLVDANQLCFFFFLNGLMRQTFRGRDFSFGRTRGQSWIKSHACCVEVPYCAHDAQPYLCVCVSIHRDARRWQQYENTFVVNFFGGTSTTTQSIDAFNSTHVTDDILISSASNSCGHTV